MLTTSMKEAEEREEDTREIQESRTEKSSSIKRPLSVTLLGCLVFIITGLHLIRFVRTVYLWEILLDLPGVPVLYIALSGLVWTVIGIPVLWLIWRRHPKAPGITCIAALIFTIYYWLDRLLVASTSFEELNWPFVAAVNFILLVFTFWASANPKSSKYFKALK